MTLCIITSTGSQDSDNASVDVIKLLLHVSHNVASGSEITPCIKIDKPLVVHRFMGNGMTSMTTLRT